MAENLCENFEMVSFRKEIRFSVPIVCSSARCLEANQVADSVDNIRRLNKLKNLKSNELTNIIHHRENHSIHSA